MVRAKSRAVRTPVEAPVNPATGGVMRPYRYPKGVVALREIRRYQKTVDLLMQKTPFARLVKDIAAEVSTSSGVRVQKEAVEALQEATEAFTVELFRQGMKMAVHAKRVTLKPEDLKIAAEMLMEK